jgi:hypothetical protein
MSQNLLPEKFANLEKYLVEWDLPNEEARFKKLHSTNMVDLKDFYDAMCNRIEEILDYLDQFNVNELFSEEKKLYDLTMTFAEVAHPIDLNWQEVDFPDAYAWEKFEFRSVSVGR